MKKSEKIAFLIILVGVAALARFIYPSIPALPSLADASDPNGASSTSGTTSSVPLLALTQTTAIGADAENGQQSGGAGTGANAATSTPLNSVFTRIATTPVPSFKSQSYLVADLTTGAVLAGSNISARWPTASITKLMTATLTLDDFSTSSQITISPAMFSADPSEYTLALGGTYTVQDLLRVMLMPSSNVAAEAFADTVGYTQFMAAMNQRAEQWGMTDTYFEDPSGISAANESTAEDLLVLAQHVYNQYPEVFALTDVPSVNITNLANGKTMPVKSINAFAGESVFVGGKTGNTPQAGANLLSVFSYHGHPVVIIILGEQTLPFGDTTKLYDWFRQDFE